MSSKGMRTGRHCAFKMHVHLVFVTKYRKKVFTKNHFQMLQVIFKKVCNDFEVDLLELNGAKDHVHILLNYPPKVAISKLVNSLKGVSSRKLRRYCQDLKKYYWKGVLWSPGYFAGSCGGAPLEIVKQYIRKQN